MQSHVIELTNQKGMKVLVSNLGAVITHIFVPDKNGQAVDVVLGLPKLEDYAHENTTYFGATIGRSANRIEGARFELEGKDYQLALNEPTNNLHSGPKGYETRLWTIESQSDDQVTLSLVSDHMDQGYPGQLKMFTSIQLTPENQVIIRYSGLSDQTTLFNPTNHSYFNLNGHDSGDILDHELVLYASSYTPVKDEKSIPTGQIQSVQGTPMDFLTPHKIGERIDQDFNQLQYAGGYDHNYVLDSPGLDKISAIVYGPKTGIELSLSTDLPGIQFYSGNFIDNKPGKGLTYQKRAGLCLETQYYPNAINQANFPSPILQAGVEKTYTTIWKFTTRL